MTQRSLTTIGLYCLIFGAVVVWASLRPSGDRPGVVQSVDGVGVVQSVERSEGIREMRRIIQHMVMR